MAEEIVIDVSEMRHLADRLFDVLESRGKTRIKVPKAPYWMVFAADVFNVEPPALVTGDAEDDLMDARSDLALENEDVVSIWHAAHHLAGLMQLIAHADLKHISATDERRT
ncbi:MAG TPA: hypothetical protein VGX71_26495 [Pseudaminobacter sp.]|jgi:hypothetical protein|nr:hypothetical protein [Pseudaminobacter sp.]